MENSRTSDDKSKIFNYSDIFFSCFFDNATVCQDRAMNHSLNYVLSGEMLLDDGQKKVHVRKGECVFIRRDHRVTFYKQPHGGEQYCGIFLMFTRNFLREMFNKLQPDLDDDTPKLNASIIKLPRHPEIESLFGSMTPYFNLDVAPSDDIMRLKMQEGLLALLHADQRYAPTLFDFNEPWKIDIMEFMSQNYMYDFTLEELATFTGRSLSSFKRDFKKISDLTPQKWLIQRRLEAAYEMMKEGGKKVQDVYVEVGFKNPSHFSTAFRKRYGIPPTALQ